MDECPLCMEELDVTDKATLYCHCEYQVCAFCWQQLHDNAAKDNTIAKCPNCRTPYDKDNIRMLEIDQEELERMKSRKHERKTRPGGALGPGGAKAKRDLANIRVLQKNLVYAVGLAAEICDEELLKGSQYFGQFGKIIKISVNRPTPTAVGIKTTSGSAYITYKRVQDAERCIKTVDDATWMGRHVRVCYGTTKYCNAFLKGLPCNNADCLYLHDIAEEEISFTKEEMAHIGPAKFAGHTGMMPTASSLKRILVGGGGSGEDLAGDMPSPMPSMHSIPPPPPPHGGPSDISTPIAVPRMRGDGGMWDNTNPLTSSPPGGPGRGSSWASTLLGVGPTLQPGAPPPAVDSTTDFPELSAPAADGPARPPPATNGTTMAEQLARAASGPGTPLTAASRLKARKEESVKKMQPISPAAKGPRTGSRLGASASSLSELEGSRPGSGQHDGYGDGDGMGSNGQLEDAQHLAASMTWQVIDGDGIGMEAQAKSGAKRPPPPGFEHVGKGAGVSSHPLAAEGTMSSGDMKHVTSILLQFSLEAILAAAEVPLPTYGRMATESRFSFARRNGTPAAHSATAHWMAQQQQQQQAGQMGMQLLRQLQGGGMEGVLATQAQQGGLGGLYAGAPAVQANSAPFPPNWK